MISKLRFLFVCLLLLSGAGLKSEQKSLILSDQPGLVSEILVDDERSLFYDESSSDDVAIDVDPELLSRAKEENLDENKPFIIGSFNMQNYGPTKANRTSYLDVVVRIVSKYDICLLQEVTDIKEKAIYVLLDYLNNYIKEDSSDIEYKLVMSERVGLGSRKEQYVFMYRSRSFKQFIEVERDYIYNDTQLVYDRPPHVGKFKISGTSKSSIRDFYLVNIHTRPSYVLEEVLQFHDVLAQIVKRESLPDSKNYNVVVMGDFNFACSYISASNRDLVRDYLSMFSWFISDANPTTISKSQCAYDRIIVSGYKLETAIFPESNRTYRYDLEFNLNEQERAAISDHYPIEFQLF